MARPRKKWEPKYHFGGVPWYNQGLLPPPLGEHSPTIKRNKLKAPKRRKK